MLSTVFIGLAEADSPRLAAIFQDNMVLQRDAPIPVWGWATPGTTVAVEFEGQVINATAGPDGRWQGVLGPMPASSEGRVLRVRVGTETIELKNVLVGEVWVTAGQSNMCAGGPDLDTGVYPFYVSPAGPKPEIRLIDFGWGASLEPWPDVDPVGPAVKPWSSLPEIKSGDRGNIPQFFARFIRDALNVPVGIIHLAVPGTNQTAWMPRETLEQFPGAGDHENFYLESFASRDANLAKTGGPIRSWAQFKVAEDEWRRTKQGTWPGRSLGLNLLQYPTVLYNTRVHPVAPFAIRGVIWHQGEAGPGGPYGARLVAMVREWRKVFGQDFFFVWGTLSRNTRSSPPVEPRAMWFYRSATNTELRRAAPLFEGDPKVEWVEFYDLGNHDTHFEQKAEAGRRMALAALHKAYGKPAVFSGPRLTQLTIEGARAVAQFELVGAGVVYRPSFAGISGVLVKGKTGLDRWAEVKVLDARSIEITHPDGVEITGIGYGAASNPHETLFNSEGLPASPFDQNLGPTPHDGPSDRLRLVAAAGEAEGVGVNVVHVRREGYVFNLKVKNATPGSTQQVRALISPEWNGVEVRAGGQNIAPEISEAEGRRFATFDAPANGAWIIVAATGQATTFEKINRF